MKRLLCLIVPAVLFVGCNGGKPDQGEPWDVVATQMNVSTTSGISLSISYISPVWEIVRWERPVGSLDPSKLNEQGAGWVRCWQSVKVGQSLPACAREEPALK
jgi:hypothetical protein